MFTCPGSSAFLAMPTVIGQAYISRFLGNSSQTGKGACVYKHKIQILLSALKFESLSNWLPALSWSAVGLWMHKLWLEENKSSNNNSKH